jgi:anaerobic magnesium-protoporphyrin IX monomethyl ester cyclase
MRQHGILSMATWVVGFEEETDRDHWRGLRQLLSYDPHQVQLLTSRASLDTLLSTGGRTARDPGRSAALGLLASGACDAPHVALACAALVQVHRDGAAMPAACDIARRAFAPCDALLQQMGRRVLPCEILNFLRDRLVKRGPTVAESGVRRRTARRNRCRRPSPSVARRRATQPRPRPSLSGCRGIIY